MESEVKDFWGFIELMGGCWLVVLQNLSVLALEAL